MEKQLNTSHLQEAASKHGLSQTAIAKALGLTKASVSKWFTGKSFPRPAELLKLGRLLELSYDDLVQRSATEDEPIVAFRRRGSCKTTAKHVAQAQDMGRLLKPLVKFLDVDEFMAPPSLKSPSCDYDYMQGLVSQIRLELNIGEHAKVDFGDLINLFHEHQAIIIPTMWGRKTKHENAIHIHLPESQTTWIYLNLDVEIHDFKFWMAHELGHVLTIDLLREKRIDEAEDFAECFAGALLFPESLAKEAYAEYAKAKTSKQRLKCLGAWAEKHTISPNSVYHEIQHFAKARGHDFDKLKQPELWAYITNFNKQFQTLSEYLFDDKVPSADHFMRVAHENFGTEIYSALGQYMDEKDAGPGTLATILGVNSVDAKSYYSAFKG